MGSLNGTYVNRDRIDEVALQGGDEVQIGKYRLVFFASHTPAHRATAMRQSASSRARLSIGEVLEQLRGDFPGLNISKIRFLEAEGLIEPERTPSGYRKFSTATWSGSATSCTCQREHYLPAQGDPASTSTPSTAASSRRP